MLPHDLSVWLDMNLIITINHEKGLCWWLAEPATKIYSQSGRSLVELGLGRASVTCGGDGSAPGCLRTTICHSKGKGSVPAW